MTRGKAKELFMKKLITILLTLSLILSLAACGEKDKDDRSDRKKNDETEVETKTTEAAETTKATEEATEAPVSSAELVVTLPDGWEKNEASTSPFQYQKGFATFIIVEDKSYASIPLNEAADNYFETLSSAFDNVKQIGETTEYDMNGIDAIRFTFTAEVGIDMEYIYFFFKAGSKLYVGTVGTTVDEYSKMEAELEQVVSSAVSIA